MYKHQGMYIYAVGASACVHACLYEYLCMCMQACVRICECIHACMKACVCVHACLFECIVCMGTSKAF